MCLVSKIEPWISSYWNFTQVETIVLISKNVIFNGNSFAIFETAIKFLASKRIREWSQILISSPGWPCMQNNVTFNYQFYRLSQKTWLFTNDFKHRKIIYHWKVFLVTTMNSILLPQNTASFAQINSQSLSFLYENVCRWSAHFCPEQRIPSWRTRWRESFVA